MDQKLIDDLRGYSGSLRGAYRKNNRMAKLLVLAGILLSCGITIGGIFRVRSEFLGVAGAVLSVVLVLDRAFAFADRAAILRILYTECIILIEDPSVSDAEARLKFRELRLRRAQSHTGEGLRALTSK
jgi:hypothetical protein